MYLDKVVLFSIFIYCGPEYSLLWEHNVERFLRVCSMDGFMTDAQLVSQFF